MTATEIADVQWHARAIWNSLLLIESADDVEAKLMNIAAMLGILGHEKVAGHIVDYITNGQLKASILKEQGVWD